MPRSRSNETLVLGYPIERIDEYSAAGALLRVRYDVLCPHTGAILGRYPDRRRAQEFVLHRELAAMPGTAVNCISNLAA